MFNWRIYQIGKESADERTTPRNGYPLNGISVKNRRASEGTKCYSEKVNGFKSHPITHPPIIHKNGLTNGFVHDINDNLVNNSPDSRHSKSLKTHRNSKGGGNFLSHNNSVSGIENGCVDWIAIDRHIDYKENQYSNEVTCFSFQFCSQENLKQSDACFRSDSRKRAIHTVATKDSSE